MKDIAKQYFICEAYFIFAAANTSYAERTSYDKLVGDGRRQGPHLHLSGRVCEEVLVLLRVGVGREGGLAIVDEDLGGAAVDEDAELPQVLLQGHVQDLEDVLVEALVQAPAV